MNERIVVVVGPTAAGKTRLACELSEKLLAEVVSADSQQCYRGLDAATAKPTAEEQARAPHHLLDFADPEEQLDAAVFVKLADAAIADISRRGKRVIVAGGTGLWIRALLRGLLAAPGRSEEFRAALRRDEAEVGVAGLHERLARVDPEAAQAIRPTDRVRIERALEVHALTGSRLSELQRRHGFAEERYAPLVLHVSPPREVLWDRIAVRTRELFRSGALERETRSLLARIEQVPAAARALKIIGYGEMAAALRGSFPVAEAEDRVSARTRRYAKRQGTWFRRDAGPPLAWPIDVTGLSDRALRWYEGRPG
ncbi:MAG: tRNA (adenosine(37)-N6)-dimethylallyltransferase MiaA [Myxococcales bacterium]